MKPEITTPRVAPRIVTPPNPLIAWARSLGSLNRSATSDSAAGDARASPRPCANRAPDKHRASPEHVGDAPPDDQEASGDERVSVDDPGQSAGAEVERVLDRRQRDVHDRAGERENELGQREQQ